jgi:hypothetical protein
MRSLLATAFLAATHLLPAAHAGGLPTLREILDAHRALVHTPTFDSNLFGDEHFNISPFLQQSLVPSGQVGAPDWEVDRTYVRIMFGRFLTREDELGENWFEFDVSQKYLSEDPWRVWRHRGTGQLTARAISDVGPGAASPFIADDGKFLQAQDPLRNYQVLLFYPGNDLGFFVETCVPFRKGTVEYLFCRQRTDATRALPKMRYWILARISDAVGELVPNLGRRVVDQIINGQVPSELVPEFKD